MTERTIVFAKSDTTIFSANINSVAVEASQISDVAKAFLLAGIVVFFIAPYCQGFPGLLFGTCTLGLGIAVYYRVTAFLSGMNHNNL